MPEAKAELHRVVFRGSNADVAAAATITDLQAASKALQGKGGMDPFPAAMQVPCAIPTIPTSVLAFLFLRSKHSVQGQLPIQHGSPQLSATMTVRTMCLT